MLAANAFDGQPCRLKGTIPRMNIDQYTAVLRGVYIVY